MKKLLTVALIFALTLSLTACAAIPMLLLSDSENTESDADIAFIEESLESTATIDPGDDIFESADDSSESSETESSQTASHSIESSENESSKATESKDTSKATSSKTTSSKATSSKATSSKATSSKATSSKVVSSNTAENPSADGNVYRTPSGKRYHLDPNCGGKNSFQTTYDKAISAGLTPCQKCAQ